MEFQYERLDVARLARELVTEIYKLTKKFPNEELYGLVSQLRRAAVSVLLNLAEGSSRNSRKEFARFGRCSIGSLVEVDAGLKVSIDLKLISAEEYKGIEPKIRELYFKSVALVKSLKIKSN